MNLSVTLRRLSCIWQHLHPTEVRYLQSASAGGTSRGVRWLQPAGSGAKRMEEGHQKGVLHFPVCVTVNTAEPLKTEHLQKCLVHLFNKIPPLRTCFRYREGELWHCEMETRKIDFKEVNGKDFFEELAKLMDCLYTDSDEGPLWRVRLMKDARMTEHSRTEVLPEFPYPSIILLSLHHGMTDGNASYLIVLTLIKILEQVIAGIPVDEEEQIGFIASDEQTLAMKREIRDRCENHPDEVEHFVKNHLQLDFIPLLYEAFGFPKVPNPTTRYLISRLHTETLQRFRAKCADNDVTFNAGFVLAINTALVELAREAGVHREVFRVTSRHGLNLRRYWRKDQLFSLGCHIGRMPQITETPPYNKSIFWKYAKPLHTQLREKLKNGHALKEEVVKEIKNIKTHRIEHNNPLPVDCDYYLSNATLPNEVLKSDSDHKYTKVTDIVTFIQMHLCEYMTFHLVAGPPGGMSYTISYSTWHITDDNAMKFLRKVESIVEDLAE